MRWIARAWVPDYVAIQIDIVTDVMKILVWLLRLLILVALVLFSIRNSDPVVLRGFDSYTWQAPLIVVILVFFAGGIILGLFASLGSIYRLKREVGALKRLNRSRDKAPVPVVQDMGDHGA